jgi:ABC-2 type transport system ATP-binding protein
MDSPAPIQVENLHKRFGQVQALKGVDLQVEKGQIFGLLGPNGAGKTTLIRLMIGASKPNDGRISVLGFEPTSQKHALRELIGYMPQDPALYEDLSPRANLRFFGAAHPLDNLDRRIEQVLEFVGLLERADHPVHTFSGGMKQRVSLACALVHRPQMLFLDEPTSGIDPQLRALFWQHFRELAAGGVTLIISTHQMDEAGNCTQLAVLHQGTVLATGTPRSLWLAHGTARVKVWRGKTLLEQEMADYPRQLPSLLHTHGLDPRISRIEIEEDTLETVVLKMINDLEVHGRPEKSR